MKMDDQPVLIDLGSDREDVAAVIRSAAWTEPQNGCEYCDHTCGDEPRKMVHVRTLFGMDLPLDSVLEDLANADRAAWQPDFMDHELRMRVVDPDGEKHVRAYDVRMPTDWTETHTPPAELPA